MWQNPLSWTFCVISPSTFHVWKSGKGLASGTSSCSLLSGLFALSGCLCKSPLFVATLFKSGLYMALLLFKVRFFRDSCFRSMEERANNTDPMLQGVVKIEVQVLISVCCLVVNLEFDGTVRFTCDKSVRRRQFIVHFRFAGELNVHQTVVVRGEIINSVTVDLHECIVDIKKPYRRSYWGGCNSQLFKIPYISSLYSRRDRWTHRTTSILMIQFSTEGESCMQTDLKQWQNMTDT